MAKPFETHWKWLGDPLGEPNADGRVKYRAAQRQRPNEKNLKVTVGDVALMYIEDPESDEGGSVWVAQLLELCMLGPGERLDAADEELDEDGNAVDGGGDAIAEPLDDNARMRIGVRWLFRPSDYAAEQDGLPEPDPEPVPPLGAKELLWTDAIEDPICNGIDVVGGLATLVSNESQLEVIENGCFCNRYYFSHCDTYDINVPANPPAHLAGKRLRPIKAMELKQLLGRPSQAKNGFWMERKVTTPRKSVGRKSKVAVARGVPALDAGQRVEGEALAAAKPSSSDALEDLALEDVIGRAGVDGLVGKVMRLTPSQLGTLEDNLPALVAQLTGAIDAAAAREPGGVFGSHEKFERARDAAVKESLKHYWAEHAKPPATAGTSRGHGQPHV